MEIEVREFRDQMSRYLAAVRDGDEVTITDDGEPVARLVPPDHLDSFERLVAEGIVIPAKEPKDPLPGPLVVAEGTVSDLVIEQRR